MGWCIDGWIRAPEDKEKYRPINAREEQINMRLSILRLQNKGLGTITAAEIGKFAGLPQEDEEENDCGSAALQGRSSRFCVPRLDLGGVDHGGAHNP